LWGSSNNVVAAHQRFESLERSELQCRIRHSANHGRNVALEKAKSRMDRK
jgi:hypothetical protein